MIKGVDKSSVVAVWGRENYMKEAENQFGDTNIYEKVPRDAKPLMNIILNTLEKIRKRGDVCKLFGIVGVILIIFVHVWISIYSQLPKKSNHI